MKRATIPASTILVEAQYRKTGIIRFDRNPFIEALPPLPKMSSDFSAAMEHYPREPSDASRRKSEVVRKMEVLTINDLVFPFPEFDKAGLALATIIRESYVARNPMTTLDVQRRHAMAARGTDGLPFPSNWRSSAKGHLITAVSGMGKTTLVSSFLLQYPQVIRHMSYHKKSLRCHQVVYLFLRIPHDGTLKSLCLQFFSQIDELLGTNYTRQARGLRNIAPMVELMNQVATAVSLGLVVFDEVQNLRSASGANAEIVLNLFTETLERLGISVVIMATPAIQTVLYQNVRNVRKLTSSGITVIPAMKKDDEQWYLFCDACWEYTFVKNKPVLSDEVRHIWHKVSAGNTAFATLAFMISQRNEIGGREIVDEDAFERTAAKDMAFLQPAISALLSRDPKRLQKFDDRRESLPVLAAHKHMREQEERKRRRLQWERTLASSPSMNGSSVRRKESALYAWLCRHDKAWLLLSNNHHTADSQRAASIRVDWDARDRKLSDQLKAHYNALRSQADRERISRTKLIRPLGEAMVRKHLRRLPQVSRLLEILVESPEMFRRFRIDRAIAYLQSQGLPLTLWRIQRSAGIKVWSDSARKYGLKRIKEEQMEE